MKKSPTMGLAFQRFVFNSRINSRANWPIHSIMNSGGKKLIGFRQYLNSPHSYEDLRRILSLPEAFPLLQERGYDIMVALCGDHPGEFTESAKGIGDFEILDFTGEALSPLQLVKRLVQSLASSSAVRIIYYSHYPEGLTYPLDLFTQIATFLGYTHLAVSDSDFQIPFPELLKAFEYHIHSGDAEGPSVTFPRRKRRSLDAEDYPINRWAMEDIENLYVYFLSNIRYLDLKLDIQSGLIFTNRAANAVLDFSRVGKWIGTLHLAISLLRLPEVTVRQVEVETNLQHDSTINFDIQCAKINELYDYYLIPMENIIRIALDNPRKYLMPDWSAELPTEAIEAILRHVFDAYAMHKKQSGIAR